MFTIKAIEFQPTGIQVTYLKKGAAKDESKFIANVATLKDPEERPLMDAIYAALASIIIR